MAGAKTVNCVLKYWWEPPCAEFGGSVTLYVNLLRNITQKLNHDFSVLALLTSTESSKRLFNQWAQTFHGQSKTAPTCFCACPACQSGLGNVRGSLSRRTDHKHTHMLSLSCASRAFSQTKPLRHIGNGTVMPKDFMHTIQIHTSQHCSSMSLYISSVVLNWFCFRTQILHWTLRGETKIVYCPNIPKTWNVNPSNLLFWFPFKP